MFVLPIIRRSGLFFHHFGDGDAKLFASAFAETWRSIPLSARRRLLKYWRDTKPQGCEYKWPSIELSSAQTHDFSCGNSGDAIARLEFTMFLYFNSSAMDILPLPEYKFTIAHELAHVHILAGPGREEHLADVVACKDLEFSWAEQDADEVADYWGFDRESTESKGD